MNLSIRVRLALAMSLIVAGVGLASGWVGVAVTGKGVEGRLVDGPAANAAGLLENLSLPLSDTMMDRLRQILGAHVLAVPADSLAPAVSSLPDYEEHTFSRLVAKGRVPRRVVMGGKAYLVGSASATRRTGRGTEGVRLYVLATESEIRAAKQAATRTILWVTLAAVALATGLGLYLADTIARPVGRLADRMRRLTAGADAALRSISEEPLAADGRTPPAAGPREVAELARSFDALVTRLDQARGHVTQAARLATLGKVAASVAHELRNPLSGIRMNAQILADEMAKAGKPDESLRRIIREADRMELYLGELMDLAKAEPAAPAGAPPPPRRRTLRLDELGEAVAGLLEGRSRHAGVEIRRLGDPHTPAVFADETQMHQVILNLVLNALDATRPGGTVTLKTLKARDGSARLEVRDTGAGVKVPPGADVFEPFVTTKASGIGLGLYVCRRNVEGHGGRIGYDSSGAGSTFWIELPPAGP